jgi:hypothetical protein
MWKAFIKENKTREKVWYFDSTGSILKPIIGEKKPFLYSMVFHDREKKIINSVFDFFTCSHFGYNVANYLSTALAFLEMFGEKKTILPSCIVTDFAWSLLNGVQNVFNRLDFIDYLNLCYDLLIKKTPLDSRILVLSILCWIHFLKNIIKKTRTLSSVKKVQIAFNLFLNILQNCIKIEEFEKYYLHIVVVLASPYKNKFFQENFQEIYEALKTRELKDSIVLNQAELLLDREEENEDNIEGIFLSFFFISISY